MNGLDDDTHAAFTELTSDLVLARDDVAGLRDAGHHDDG